MPVVSNFRRPLLTGLGDTVMSPLTSFGFSKIALLYITPPDLTTAFILLKVLIQVTGTIYAAFNSTSVVV
jgi:hypothetical protein